MSRSRLFTNPPRSISQLRRDLGHADDDAPQLPLITPADEPLSPIQQIALLRLLPRNDLAQAVLKVVEHSTAKPGRVTYHELALYRLAEPDGRGFHRLTWLGHCRARSVAQELAKEFNVTVPRRQSLARQKSRFGERWNGMAHSQNG